MDLIIYVVIAIAALAAGAFATLMVQQSMARSRAKTIVDEANKEAELIRQKELLKGREEGIKIKDEAEKQANQRMAKVQSVESKMKQREMQLNHSRVRTSASATSSTPSARG